MRVLFLGTGTSHGIPAIGCGCAVCRSHDPRDRRLRPSIYVQFDDGVSILVDTAPDLRTQALAHGLTRVDAVCFTHPHADHIMGLDDLRAFNALQGGSIAIYADEATMSDVQRAFPYAFAPPTVPGGGVPVLDAHVVRGPIAIGGHDVVPVPVWHGPRLILGFRFGAFAYLTDCSAIPEESFAAVAGVDTIVIDALRDTPHPTHFTIAEAVDAARRVGARRTYFTHIAHDLGHAATSAALPAGMALAYDGLDLAIAG